MRLYIVFQKDEKDFRAGMIKRGNVNPKAFLYTEYKKISCVSDVKDPKQFLPFEKSFWKNHPDKAEYYTSYSMERGIKIACGGEPNKPMKIWVHNKSQWS